MPSKSKAIARFRRQLDELAKVPADRTDRSGAFERWHRSARVAVERAFGDTSKHAEELSRISFYPIITTQNTTDDDRQSAFAHGLKRARLLLESFIDEIEEYWPTDDVPQVGDPSQEQYDVCLSFAGEDRQYVEAVARSLDERGIRVFYDLNEQVSLWGKDLYQHLDEIYRKRARFCVLFISEAYAKKLWTKHELRSAQARAFQEHEEYILPARFDETAIPGMQRTIAYIDLQNMSPERLAELIAKKLESRSHKSSVNALSNHLEPKPTSAVSSDRIERRPNIQANRPWFTSVSVSEQGILHEENTGPLKALVAPFRNDPTLEVPHVSTAIRVHATVTLEDVPDFRVTGYWLGSTLPFISFAPGEQWLLAIAVVTPKLASLVADGRRNDGGGSIEFKHFWTYPTNVTEVTALVTIAADGVLLGRFRYNLKITPPFPDITQLPLEVTRDGLNSA